jgi:hypothetical protein
VLILPLQLKVILLEQGVGIIALKRF